MVKVELQLDKVDVDFSKNDEGMHIVLRLSVIMDNNGNPNFNRDCHDLQAVMQAGQVNKRLTIEVDDFDIQTMRADDQPIAFKERKGYVPPPKPLEPGELPDARSW
jgi:hypothetical protein